MTLTRSTLVLLLLVVGCAQVKPAEEFAFQTEAERLDAVVAADAADAAGTDASETDAPDAQVDADAADSADAPDVADAADAVDATDAADSADTSDAVDAADTADAPDAADAADVADSADGSDAADVPDGEDAPDAADAPDATDPCPTLNCDDGNPCTDDSCLAFTGCNHSPVSGSACAPDPCHAQGTCDTGVCKFAVAVSCDDGNDCTVDGCDATTGCTHVTLNNGSCQSGSCLLAQTCKAGACQGGTAKVCTDGNPCTADSCNPATGCVFLPNTVTCDDGDACTGADACAGGTCAGVGKFLDTTFGGAGVSRILSLSDGFAIFGTSSSNGVQPWLVRTDLAGKLMWQKIFDSNNNGFGSDAVLLGDGFFLLGSREVGGGASQVELFRVDFAGNLLSENHFDAIAASDVNGRAIAARSGGYAIAGSDPSASGSGALILTDLSGDASSVTEFSAGPFSNFTALSPSGDGFILAGSTATIGGSEDFWLVRVDSTGQQIWQQTYGGSADDAANSVISLSDGYLVAGQTGSKGAGANDAWLVRTDLSGNKLWDKTYGGKQDDSALEVRAIPGGYVFSGTTASTGAGGNEMWLVRTDTLGNKMFGFPYGGTGDDGGSHLALLSDGFALAGYTNSKGAGQQAWLLRTDLFGSATCALSGPCIGKSIPDCSDGSPCTTDLCDAAHTGCWHGAPAAFACDDGLKCTGPDVCANNTCTGPAVNCNDGNPCTADSCDTEFGCVNESLDGGVCGADKCTSAGVCAAGVCAGAAAIGCDDGNPCTSDGCDLATGCTHTANTGAPCDDTQICTLNDHCTAGNCSGSPDTCDDGNACTNDACSPVSGCTHANNTVACSADGCFTGQVCSGGSCGGGTAKNCDDANGCTTDFCAFGNCAHGFLPNFTPCSTGTACTVGETCTGGVCGSGGPREFDQTYGTAGLDNAYGVTATSDGFAFVGSGPDIASGTWVVRTDLAGKAIWNNTYPIAGGGSTQGNAIVALSDGYVVCGNATISGANPDARLIHTDVNGGVVWDKTYGGTGSQSCAAVTALSDGSYAFAGTDSSGNFSLYGGRVDANGVKLWAKIIDPSTFGSGYAIASTASGLVLAGKTNSKGAGGDDMWLVSTDLNGNALWDQTYGTSSNETANAVVALSDGFALAGSSGSTFYLVRTDLNGTKLWDKTYTGNGNDVAYGLVALTDGFVLAGQTGSSGVENYWLVRTDAQGNKLWDKKYGGSGSDSGYGLAGLSDGFALIGSSDSKDIGNLDAWLVRTDSFGNASCTSSGTCDGKASTGCDDGNPCTADSCTGGTCAHTPLTIGSECTNHGFCDVSQACVAQMASIPAGTFWMGCNSVKDSNCIADESPQHKVTLSAYAMDLTETTVAQYKACVDAGACSGPSSIQPMPYATYPSLLNNPINFVNWTQAQQFCKWRGAQFDLPTEAQWEMAARGRCEENGSTGADPVCASAMRTYAWGEATATCSFAVMNNGTDGCGTNATWAVDSIPAGDSPYGLHDVAGNVHEWTRDWYSASYFAISPASDPINDTSGTERVFRGGSLDSADIAVHMSRRFSSLPSAADYDVGLRCTRSL